MGAIVNSAQLANALEELEWIQTDWIQPKHDCLLGKWKDKRHNNSEVAADVTILSHRNGVQCANMHLPSCYFDNRNLYETARWTVIFGASLKEGVTVEQFGFTQPRKESATCKPLAWRCEVEHLYRGKFSLFNKRLQLFRE